MSAVPLHRIDLHFERDRKRVMLCWECSECDECSQIEVESTEMAETTVWLLCILKHVAAHEGD